MDHEAVIEPKISTLQKALSFEALVAYYAFSGLAKAVLEYYEINTPVDITVLLLGLIVLTVTNEWLSKKRFLTVENNTAMLIILFFTFYAWIAISLIYTPSEQYGFQKTIKSITNIIFVIILLRSNFDTSRFLNISYLLIIVLLAWFIPLRFLFITGQAPKGYLFTRDVMGLYLYISMPLGLFLLFYLTSNFKYSSNKLLNLILYGIGLIGLLLLGARGPIIFFILVSSIFFIIKGKIRKTIRKRTILFSILTIFILLLVVYLFRSEFKDLIQVSISRFKLIFSGFGSSDKDFGTSINSRLDYINQSVKIIFHSFSNFIFGTGIGSFGILTIGEDARHYPHNFILEIWCELGLVGLTIFSLIILLSVRKIRISYNDLNIFPILYILLNFLKSGSMDGMRLLFTVLAVYFVSTNKPDRTLES